MPTMAEALQGRINVRDPYFDRGMVLPFGERTFPNNPHSRTEFAVPGAVYDPVMLGAKSMQQAMSGTPVNPDDVTRVAMDLGMLGAPAGAALAPVGALGMFAGKMAKTADLNAMKQAEEMLARGADRGDVWKQTGWFKDVDGQMKFEIDDSGAMHNWVQHPEATVLKDGTRGVLANVRQGDILDHDNLYSAYPSVGDVKIQSVSSAPAMNRSGAYDTTQDVITHLSGKNLSDVKSVNFHELQHAIQGREGFARGGSPEHVMDNYLSDVNKKMSDIIRQKDNLVAMRFMRPDERASYGKDIASPKDLDAKIADLQGEYDALMTERSEMASPDYAYGQYKRLAGEAEARNVQTRMDYTPEQRRASPPWETLDVPENELIVRMQNALMGNR